MYETAAWSPRCVARPQRSYRCVVWHAGGTVKVTGVVARSPAHMRYVPPTCDERHAFRHF
eukprot:scaffold27954_cov70-Phaeocystis_antarctica.AAC.4